MDNIVPSDQAVLFHPIYIVSMLTAFALFFLFLLTKDFADAREKTQYYYLQLIMLLGAVFGAKLAVLMGDALWPLKPFDQWQALLFSGRSIVGALLFGFVFSELAKPAFGSFCGDRSVCDRHWARGMLVMYVYEKRKKDFD